MNAIKKIIKILSLVFGVLLISCNNHESMVISNEYISLQLWSDWKYKPLVGIDSIEGVFESNDEEIRFSFSGMAGAGYNHKADDLYFEELIVDGATAQIVKRKSGNNIHLSMYFNKNVGSTYGSLTVTNPQNDDRYIAIFKSLHFL